MASLKFDAEGLIPAVAQDHLTGEVRMVAYMSAEALARTEASGFATFYSRSRRELWVKGATSGNRLKVKKIAVDCDEDTLLLLVEPEGPSCHTGRPSCFFRELAPGAPEPRELADGALPYLYELEGVIERRRQATAEKSYTRSLLDGGAERIGGKLEEEAGELVRAVAGESPERVASEAADLLYHALVALRFRDVSLRDVVAALAARSAQSGHAEKAARRPPEGPAGV